MGRRDLKVSAGSAFLNFFPPSPVCLVLSEACVQGPTLGPGRKQLLVFSYPAGEERGRGKVGGAEDEVALTRIRGLGLSREHTFALRFP